MKTRDMLMLFVLAGLWGASFLFVRVAVPVLGAFPLVFVRVTLGGCVMLIYALSHKQPLLWRQRWRQFLIMGLFNNAIPFTMFALAELHITGSFASIFNATTPLCTAIIAAIWLRDPLTAKKGLGLLLGLIGVGIVVGWRPTPLDTIGWLSVGACLVGALSYAIAGVYAKRTFVGVSPIVITVGQLFAASVWLTPLATTHPPTGTITPLIATVVLALALLSTVVAYMLYFRLIANVGPTSATSVTFLIPFFSGVWGKLFLNEGLEPSSMVGFLVILAGLMLVTGIRWGDGRVKALATATH